MRQHRALRAARRARSVEDGGEIVGRARRPAAVRSRRARSRSAKLPSPCARRGFRPPRRPSSRAERAHRLEHRGPAERQRRAGVGEEIFEFGQRIGGVQRQQRGPGAKTGERQHDGVGRFVDLRGDAVARLDAEIDQRLRGPARPREQFAIAETKRRRRSSSASLSSRGARARQDLEEVGGGELGTRRPRCRERSSASSRSRWRAPLDREYSSSRRAPAAASRSPISAGEKVYDRFMTLI